MKKPITQYEEVMKALETVDDFLSANADAPIEFESTGDPERPFRMEYAHEGVTETKSRYRRISIDV